MAKRKAFSVDEKLHIIDLIENGTKKSDVGKIIGVAESTIRGIWNTRETLRASYSNYDNNKSFKRMRKCTNENVDQVLLTWYKQQRGNNISINGCTLQSKADHFARVMGIPDFECSSSWIDRFKKRHNIKFGKIKGEASELNHQIAPIVTFTENVCTRKLRKRKLLTNESEENEYEESESEEDKPEENESEEDKPEENESVEKLSPVNEALSSVKLLISFYQSQPDDFQLHLNNLYLIEEDLKTKLTAN